MVVGHHASHQEWHSNLCCYSEFISVTLFIFFLVSMTAQVTVRSKTTQKPSRLTRHLELTKANNKFAPLSPLLLMMFIHRRHQILPRLICALSQSLDCRI